MAARDPERRRFITRHDVEDAAAAGRPVVVRGRDVLTDEAAQRARDLGVTIEKDSGSRAPESSTRAPSASPDDLRRAVRAAVVAELGREPAGLDGAIDRVLARRR